MLLCKHCNKECKNDNSLRNHERLCKENTNRIVKQKTEKWLNAMHDRRGKGTNQYTKAKILGLDKPIITDITRQKLSDAGKQQIWDTERKLKHSQAMKTAVLNNPDSYTASNVCGRTKIIEFNGDKFHGKCEVLVAEWLIKNNFEYERNVQPFEYFWNDGVHLYFPDFYIPKLNTFIEVKGYKTERDECKWAVVNNLIIIRKKEIIEIKNNTYNMPIA